MPATDIAKPEAGADVALFTHLAVREDAMTLYGFRPRKSMHCSYALLVSGIGPKAALAKRSTFRRPSLFRHSVGRREGGVHHSGGQKTAQRLILELKGNLAQAGEQDLFSAATAAASERLQGARDALLAMGFTLAEADLALKGRLKSRIPRALLQYA